MPTRTEFLAYAGTLKGGYGPAKGLKNNDNDFNLKYYGRRVSGNNYAWCRVYEWYVEDHFGIAGVNGGKTAYVPNGPAVAASCGARVWHKPRSRDSAAWQPGNKVDLDFNHTDEAEHTGFYVQHESDTVIIVREGNTSTSQYSDAVADKRRNVSDVLYVIETLGLAGGSNQEDDMQPSDQLKIGDWMVKHWSKDKTITDGKIAVNTALGSGYGHARAAHENTDDLVEMVTALQKTVTTLAATVAAMDARTKG